MYYMRFLYVCFLVMQFVPFYRGLIDGLSRLYRWFIEALSMVSRWFIEAFSMVDPSFPPFPSFSPSAAYLRQGYPFGVLCSALSTPSLSLSHRVSVAVFCSRRYSAVCLLSSMQSYNIFFKNANNYSLFCTIVPKNLQMSINFRTFAHSITKSQKFLWQTTKRLSSRWLA